MQCNKLGIHLPGRSNCSAAIQILHKAVTSVSTPEQTEPVFALVPTFPSYLTYMRFVERLTVPTVPGKKCTPNDSLRPN